jgi:dipeptidyl aminopeptidase/acylaminoacyl peptidase
MTDQEVESTLVDAMIESWRPSDPQISPDGAYVAWTATPYGRAGEHREQSIWLATVAGTGPGRRFTSGGWNDQQPRWSPDSRAIAFLSDRESRGTQALYLIPRDGGEASCLVRRKTAIQTFEWSPDGRYIAFTSPDEPAEEDERRKERGDDANVYGENWPNARLYILDLDSQECRKVEIGDRHIIEVTWSPDGSRIACLVSPTPELESRNHTSVLVVDLTSCTFYDVCQIPILFSVQLSWTTDGRYLALVSSHEPTPSSMTVFVMDPSGSVPRVVGPGPSDTVCVQSIKTVHSDSRLVMSIADGLTTRLEWLDPNTGARSTLYEPDSGDIARTFAVHTGNDGLPTLAMICSSGRCPAEVYAGPADSLRGLSNHHAPMSGFEFGEQEPFYWTSTDGLQLDGVLVRPVGGGESVYPLIVYIHGGPYGRFSMGFAEGWVQPLVREGYAVLMPNYRGGQGRGNEFAKWGAGLVGDMEFADIMSAVDAAIERGIADPDRLGIGGWSQGGFLTAWGVTQTDRFKAGVMGAGVSDWGMMVMSSDVPTMESMLAGGRPWDGPGPHRYMTHSPISFAKNVSTPLLILHGEEDERVPVTQAIGFHRALMENDVETVLVTYPREPHGISEAEHLRDLLRRVTGWFVTHV